MSAERAQVIDEKTWFTASELAAMALPGLPTARNRMVELISAQKWAERYNAAGELLARKGSGRGAPMEYHIDNLPISAKLSLAAETAPQVPPSDGSNAGLRADWAWFEAQPNHVKAEAMRRLETLAAVTAAREAGLGQNAAVSLTATKRNQSAATIWEWLKMVRGVPASDHLPALAPRRKGGGVKADIDPALLLFFKSYFLRPSPVGFAECYRKTVEEAEKRGITLPSPKTLTRRLRAEVPAHVIKLKREGAKAVSETLPAQRRTRAHLHAMQAVNMDGHKWDVFVKFPAKNGQPERIARPISVVIQDLFSNKIVGWRTGDTESAVLTRLAIGDMMKIGIPEELTTDNGRAFASKWITGGAKTRFRFKIREEEPLGLLPLLGVKIHWATPAHGQAKPIERAFRDLSQLISMHPLCQGAYTGNRPTAKPEDYATRAVPFEEFEALIAAGIAAYNSRQGRTTEVAKGGSFDDAFNASLVTQPVRIATPEQRRMALLTAENVRADKKTGAITLYGNTYYASELYDLAGKLVTVSFDPDDLTQTVHVSKVTGEYLCAAPIQAMVGFYDVDAAKQQAKLRAELMRKTRDATKLQGLISAHELAAMMGPGTEAAPTPEPKIIRPVRTRSNGSALLAPVNDRTPVIDRFTAAMSRQVAEQQPRKFSILDGGLSPKPEPKRPR